MGASVSQPAYNQFAYQRVEGVEPVDGWFLLATEERDGDGFTHPEYFAFKDRSYRCLPVSRFDFTPNQARFAWIVERDFTGGLFGPLTDAAIDCAIDAQRMAA